MILRRTGARRKCAAVVVATATAAAALVGVGAGTADASARRQAGGTVKVMVISQLTAGASGATTPGASAAVQARAKIANQKKQLPGGQKITVEVCDDHEDANTAAACARKAVSDGVVAVVGSASAQGDAINPILAAAGIANIGQDPISASDFSSATSFPLQSGTAGYLCGSLIRLKQKNITKADVAYIDIPAGAQTLTIAKICAPKIGTTTVNGTPVPPTSPDLTSAVTAAAEGGDGIVLATLASSAAQFIKTAKQQNVTKPIVNSNSGFTADTLKQLGSAANGTLTTNAYAPLTSKAPGILAFLVGMKKYAKGTVIEDQFGLGAWLGMDVFVKMAKAQNLTALTAANVLQGMGSISNMNTGGIIPPLTTTTPFPLPPLARIFNRTVYPGVIKNGKLVGAGPAYDALSEVVSG
jgi:branched-chain amino acid transport system substrate-binding protein